MRTDVAHAIMIYSKEEILMNKSELARRLNCNRRTIKKYFNNENEISQRKSRNINLKITKFQSIIMDKIDKYGVL